MRKNQHCNKGHGDFQISEITFVGRAPEDGIGIPLQNLFRKVEGNSINSVVLTRTVTLLWCSLQCHSDS